MIIRVLVADAHPLYRDALARVVRQRPALQLVAETGDGTSTPALLQRLRPDVAVLDPAMPGLSAARLLCLIAQHALPTRVVLLAGASRPAEAYDSIAAGATAYLSKCATADEVEAAICRAARGEATIASELQTDVATQIRRRERSDLPMLSPRELQVLNRVAAGRSAPEIAAEFIVAPSTVRTHLQRVCDKLGVRDRAAAVAVGMRLGILD